MISSAKEVAKEAHDGQYRKFEGVPFVEHPKAVASLVKSVTEASEEMIVAALLHDTVEDTNVTLPEIREEFGEKVASFVKELTTDKEKRDEFGKAAYLGYKMAGMTTDALTIKLIDRYHNTKDLEDAPDSFQNRYSRETKETLSILFENRKLTGIQRKIANEIIENVS